MLLFSILFINRVVTIITMALCGLGLIGSAVFLLIKRRLSEVIYIIRQYGLWIQNYINGTAEPDMIYTITTLLLLCFCISLVVFFFSLKKPNFYVLLIGGTALFAVQGILDYFASNEALAFFIFVILVYYCLYIYQRISEKYNYTCIRQSKFILWVFPFAAFFAVISLFIPAKKTPVELQWLDGMLADAAAYFESIHFENAMPDKLSMLSTHVRSRRTRLGGDRRLKDTLVFVVESPDNSVYLRESIKEQYTGREWRERDNKSFTAVSGKSIALKSMDETAGWLSEDYFVKNVITVTYNDFRTKTVFAPMRAKRINFDTDKRIKCLVDQDGIILSPKYLQKNLSYHVEMYNPRWEDGKLADLLRKSSDISAGPIYDLYLQLPENLPQRVRELALNVAASASNRFDKVKALENFLSSNYEYTLNPGSVPKDRDFVDYFLFDSKKGYCTYYASAMAVMARAIGIPARYVEGYHLPYKPEKGTEYYVTKKQAHAWVEVYFEGVGWLMFEPTSPFTSRRSGASQALDTGSMAYEELYEEELYIQNVEGNHYAYGDLAGAYHDGLLDDGTGKKTERAMWGFYMAAAIAVILLFITGFNCLRIKARLYKYTKMDSRSCVINMYKYYLKVLKYNDLMMKKGETALKFAQRVDSHLSFWPMSFRMVTDIFNKARYSGHAVTEEDKKVVLEFYGNIIHRTKTDLKKAKFFIYRYLLGWI